LRRLYLSSLTPFNGAQGGVELLERLVGKKPFPQSPNQGRRWLGHGPPLLDSGAQPIGHGGLCHTTLHTRTTLMSFSITVRRANFFGFRL